MEDDREESEPNEFDFHTELNLEQEFSSKLEMQETMKWRTDDDRGSLTIRQAEVTLHGGTDFIKI